MDGFLTVTNHLLGNLNCNVDEKHIFHSTYFYCSYFVNHPRRTKVYGQMATVDSGYIPVACWIIGLKLILLISFWNTP